jgi:hypothetical protein
LDDKDKNDDGVHWSFRAIGAVALVWYVMGSINFYMQMSPEMLAGYPEAARSLIKSRPVWATAGFAIADFGGVTASLLLMLRKSAAYYVFIVVLLGVSVTNIHTFASGGGSIEIWAGSLMSLAVAGFLIWYSKWAGRNGWIRATT